MMREIRRLIGQSYDRARLDHQPARSRGETRVSSIKAGDPGVNTLFLLLLGAMSALTAFVLFYRLIAQRHRRSYDERNCLLPVWRSRLAKVDRETLDGTLDERLARIMRNGIERRILTLPPDNPFSTFRTVWPAKTITIAIALSLAAFAIYFLVGPR